MTLPKLAPSTRMGDQVYNAVQAAIMRGDLPAGHTLRIRNLATELGTSVMPVREALRRLEEIGLVEALPHRGAVVKSFTPEELLHVYQVRKLLEVEAARCGIGQFHDRDLPQLEQAYAAMEDALSEGDIVAYLDRDEAFHAVVYESAGNPVLVETIPVSSSARSSPG